ncbi:MAG: 23S rRNA (guanosine(2251)-2'-O)-methyltransferase RlmB [Gammaproteobacteria bacterium]|nr:23S rRNA (guanosine(2251)-2'-O)-methyltransferase RlmB [Gammaproteobacteria bacterium]
MPRDDVICGYHAVLSALDHHPDTVAEIFLQDKQREKRAETLVQRARAAGVRIKQVSRVELDQIVGEQTRHQGVVARLNAQIPPLNFEAFLETLDNNAFLLVLDGIQDPHNLGACLRSADAAGVQAVIIPKDKAASITPVVRRAASGAAEVMPLYQVTNLARSLREIKDKGVWLVGTSDDAEESLYEADLTGPMAIVMGSEGKGMRHLTREHCDKFISIPMHGTVSSLNVSVATGVCLFEAMRQRTRKLK